MSSSRGSGRWAAVIRGAWPFAAGGAALALFWEIGHTFFQGFTLDLGSVTFPAPLHASLLLSWSVFGTAAAAFLALGLARWATTGSRLDRISAEWRASSETWWIVGGAILAFLLPVAIRVFVLHGAQLTDDETAYEFAARLLASGRLSVPSPPMKLFFDRTFMINDGRMFSSYFLGWPALMAPGIWLGAPGLMNPLYSALTVPALFLIVRRLAGASWAKAGVLLYLASPLLMTAAATELAHTSCLAALAWTFWLALRTGDQGAPLWTHAALAAAFVVAFFVRPLTALGLGGPLLVAWALRLRRTPRRARSLAAFLLPALAGAALFLIVDTRLYGGPFTTGYGRFGRYAEENDYRFVTFQRGGPPVVAGLEFDDLGAAAGRTAAGLLRLDFALFGWPFSFLFALLAGFSPRTRLAWWSLAGFFALHFFQVDSGIDSFGPTHLVETGLPLIVLSTLGVARMKAWTATFASGADAGTAVLCALPAALPAAFVLTAILGYLPPRFVALEHVAGNLALPRETAQEAGLHDAVVFSPWPFAPSCRSWPTHLFLFERPNNHPDLDNDPIWVNHLSLEKDRELMARVFPDRTGYVMLWSRDCNVHFLPLAELAPGSIPDGRTTAGDVAGSNPATSG